MNPIEKAIRSALEKGDAADRAFREKVYRSVHAALERTLQANPDATPEMIRQRRQTLKATISSVETEFVPAIAPAPAAPSVSSREPAPEAGAVTQGSAVAPAVDISGERRTAQGGGQGDMPRAEPRPGTPAARSAAPGARVEPRLDEAPPAGGSRNDPKIEAAAPQPLVDAPERPVSDGNRETYSAPEPERRQVRRSGRGRMFAGIFLAATLLAAVGIGVWWVADQGLLKSPEDRDTSVPNPPQTLEDEDFDPADPPGLAGEGTDDRDWIIVFTPTDPTTVSTPAGTSAEIIEAEGDQALRISSQDGEAAVVFDIGEGVLAQIAGKTAVFDIVARAREGEDTQMSVACNLGGLGDCGRNRYNVVRERGDYLFDLELPGNTPGSAGTMAIVSDIDGGGKAVDIFEIRVAVTQ